MPFLIKAPTIAKYANWDHSFVLPAVQADTEMAKKLEARGFSVSDVDPREKPSSVMQSMEETLDSLTDGVEEWVGLWPSAI